MSTLLRHKDQVRWELEGLELAIKERVGEPEHFIGRVEELTYLYTWAQNIKKQISRSIAFLGRRKIGFQRLGNQLLQDVAKGNQVN